MGLSRRMFTKEFKLAAVRRLEQGVSIGEVARALEVNANVLHRWRREFRQGAAFQAEPIQFPEQDGRRIFLRSASAKNKNRAQLLFRGGAALCFASFSRSRLKHAGLPDSSAVELRRQAVALCRSGHRLDRSARGRTSNSHCGFKTEAVSLK